MNRYDLAKLAAGGCLAAVFTATVSGPLGFGLRYADQLERRVRSTLDAQHLQSVEVAIEQRPTLRRAVVLSGSVSEQKRRFAVALARDVPGIAQVRWVQGSVGTSGAGSGFSVQYR